MDENKKLEKPSKAYFYKVREDDISGRGFKQLIGYVGFIFPIALYLIAGLRPINDQPSWRPLSSLSAYYYTSSTFVFGGVLFVLAAFFFIYRGYDNKKNYLDRRAAIIAWISALLVAFFPTGAPQGFIEPTWWAQWMQWVHNISALILFGSFAYFSLGLFTGSDDKKEMDEQKKRDNRFYTAYGWLIILCIVLAVVLGIRDNSVFWPEVVAVYLFSFSWLHKGHAGYTIRYIRNNPKQTVEDVANTFRPT